MGEGDAAEDEKRKGRGARLTRGLGPATWARLDSSRAAAAKHTCATRETNL